MARHGLAPLACAVAVATAVGACGTLRAAQRDERGKNCGFLEEPIAAQFALPHARDYHDRIPRMGEAPELEHDGAVFVVAFPGPINLLTTGTTRSGPRPPVVNVVCVLDKGSATFYSDVDLAGIH